MNKVFLSLVFAFFIASSCSNLNKAKSLSNDYKIVYNIFANRANNDYEIYIMDADGSNAKNLSNWKGVDWAYHSYKDKIFFLSDRDSAHRHFFLYEMDINGEHVRQITDYLMSDSWFSSRKDGKQLIVKPHAVVDSAFYIIDLNGNILHKIKPKLDYYHDPHFSPDGTEILFRGSTKATKRMKGFIGELYIMNADGSNLRQITHYPKNDSTAEWWAYKSGPPHWLNNDKITYSSKQEGNYSIYQTNSKGKKAVAITGKELNQVYHDWTDEEDIMVYDAFDTETNSYNIYLLDIATKNEIALTNDTIYQSGPLFVRSTSD